MIESVTKGYVALTIRTVIPTKTIFITTGVVACTTAGYIWVKNNRPEWITKIKSYSPFKKP